MLYGIYGSGELTPEAAEAHLGRLCDALATKDEDFWLMIHLPAGDTSDGLVSVLEWCAALEVYYVPFTDGDIDAVEYDIDSASEAITSVKDIGRKFVSAFKKADGGAAQLLALSTGADEADDDEFDDVLTKVIDAGFPVLDLGDGLKPIELEGDSDADEDPEEDEDKGADKGRYTRKELEAMELKELRALCLAEGNKVPALHHTQTSKMRSASLIKYLLGEGEPAERDEEEEPEAEAPPARRGRAAAAEAPAEKVPGLGVREILVKHLTALLEELQG